MYACPDAPALAVRPTLSYIKSIIATFMARPVHIRLDGGGQIVVHHDVNLLEVNAARKHIGADEHLDLVCFELAA